MDLLESGTHVPGIHVYTSTNVLQIAILFC